MKRTLKDICDLHGITIDIIKAAKSHGVNHWNDGEMKTYLAGRRHRISPDAVLSKPDPLPDTMTTEESMEAIEVKLRNATNANDAKIYKTILDGLKVSMQIKREMRQLIPVGEVEERDIRIAAAVKAGVLQLCNDCAPMVEGLDASKAHRVLHDQGVCVLEMLADEQSIFWKEAQ